jgi:hypothetical protein
MSDSEVIIHDGTNKEEWVIESFTRTGGWTCESCAASYDEALMRALKTKQDWAPGLVKGLRIYKKTRNLVWQWIDISEQRNTNSV